MVEVKTKIELINAVFVRREDEILVRDPDLIEYLVKECDIKPKPPEDPSPDFGTYDCVYHTPLSDVDIAELLKLIIAIITAIGVVVAIVLGYLSIKDALKKGYDVEIKGVDPRTGKIDHIKFTRPKPEGSKTESNESND